MTRILVFRRPINFHRAKNMLTRRLPFLGMDETIQSSA